jgi:glycosyltransferase involved in cell wall biosynthesis
MDTKITSALFPSTRNILEKIEPVDILIGIPSYNNAQTISFVIYQAAKGLETYFPDKKAVIFVSDGNSQDDTLAVVRKLRLSSQVQVIPSIYNGVSGKGSAIKAILEAASLLNVKALGHIDSDLRSITHHWIKRLISPILKGIGFVTPYYVRHKYDGTITNFICYPVTSTLYNTKIRQPIGGDFALSIDLARDLLQSPLWKHPHLSRFGIDIFETHTALAKGYKVKQAFLGAKIHDMKDPSKDLTSMFIQVLGSLYHCISFYEKEWKSILHSSSVDSKEIVQHTLEPEPVELDLQSLITTYKEGVQLYRSIYKKILPDDLFRSISRLSQSFSNGFFTSETWAKIVYSFFAGLKSKLATEEKILHAFRIIWIGKIAKFVTETLNMDMNRAETLIFEEAKVFRNLKQYFIDIF